MFNWQACAPELRGLGLHLRGLRADDFPALFAITPRDTFTYFLNEPATWTLDAFAAWARDYMLQPSHMAFAVIDGASGRIVGSTSYLDILPEHRHVEIGVTWYMAEARGTWVNPACKHLMLEHAFSGFSQRDMTSVTRVTLKCNALNHASRRAIAKLGATYEGTLRSHRWKVCADGSREARDTAYFSILASEWPAVSAGLLARVRHAGGERLVR